MTSHEYNCRMTGWAAMASFALVSGTAASLGLVVVRAFSTYAGQVMIAVP